MVILNRFPLAAYCVIMSLVMALLPVLLGYIIAPYWIVWYNVITVFYKAM